VHRAWTGQINLSALESFQVSGRPIMALLSGLHMSIDFFFFLKKKKKKKSPGEPPEMGCPCLFVWFWGYIWCAGSSELCSSLPYWNRLIQGPGTPKSASFTTSPCDTDFLLVSISFAWPVSRAFPAALAWAGAAIEEFFSVL